MIIIIMIIIIIIIIKGIASFKRKAFGEYFLCHKKKIVLCEKRNFMSRESFFDIIFYNLDK